jgi:hypothetical protein
MATLARRGHRRPEIRPQTSPRKDKSTALRATTAPPWPAKGVPKGGVKGGLEIA